MMHGRNRILAALSLIIAGVAGRIFLRSILPNTPHIYLTINGITQPVFMMDMFLWWQQFRYSAGFCSEDIIHSLSQWQ